ncbi:hypothetical protein Tco_0837678 [Tanacetum coccineum]
MLVGISRYYDLDENCYPAFWADDDEEMDFFAFIHHADPTKVRIGEREVREGEVSLLELTRGSVVLLVGVNQGNVNGGVVMLWWRIKLKRKRKIADGASGSNHPPKKLREDHDTFGHVGASSSGKSLVAIQELFEESTLNVEVDVRAVATIPFVTSSVTPTPERRDGEPTNSISMANLRTQRPSERFVISLDTPHDSSANAADDEVTSIVRSSVPPPPLMTVAIATTIVTGATFAPVLAVGTEPVPRSNFKDFASPSAADADAAGPSQPPGAEPSADTFYISQDMDPETLQQICVPKWDVINDSSHDDLEVCKSMVDQLTPPDFFSQLRGIDYIQLFAEFNLGVACQVCFSAEDVEATEAIRLRHQVAIVEATEATRVAELNVLKQQVADVEFTAAAKDAELSFLTANTTQLTHDLSSLQTSFGELTIKAASLESEKDGLVGQTTCSELRDQVAGLDVELMGMALHLNEEFYPHFLTTISEWRWILSRGLRLVVMKCLQSLEYLATLGGAIGHAIDKGMQDGLAADINHGKARRDLVDVAAYNPSMEDNYDSAVNALCAMDFPLLA